MRSGLHYATAVENEPVKRFCAPDEWLADRSVKGGAVFLATQLQQARYME
jgi:hypothetical protein